MSMSLYKQGSKFSFAVYEVAPINTETKEQTFLFLLGRVYKVLFLVSMLWWNKGIKISVKLLIQEQNIEVFTHL